jgi:hypothetical protein
MDKPNQVLEDIPPSKLLKKFYDPTLSAEERAHVEELMAANLRELAVDPDIQRELRQIELESSGLARNGSSEE